MKEITHSRFATVLSICIVVIGCLLRLIWLEADLDYYIWEGYIIDEGRWIENARKLLLFDQLLAPSANVHLFVAPLFQAVSFLVFVLFEMSRWSARLFPAICGCLILILLWKNLRHRVNAVPLVIGLTLLATQEDLVMLSRVCIPEMPAMLLELAIFLTILGAQDRLARTLSAGILMVLCLGIKATTAPVFIVFCTIAWMNGNPAFGCRMRRLWLFCAPTLLVGGIAASAVVVNSVVNGVSFQWVQTLISDIPIFVSFIRFNDAYTMISFPFDSPLAPTINIWLLGAWLGALSTLLAPEVVDKVVRRWLVAAMIWVVSYVAFGAAFEYYPERYLAHILIPLAILSILSIHSFLRVGLNSITRRVCELGRGRRVYASVLLALPSAILLASIMLWLLGFLNPVVDRLLWNVLVIGAMWIFMTSVLQGLRAVWIARAVLFPIAAFLTWFAGHQLFGWHFWTTANGFDALAQWGIILGTSVVAVTLLSRNNRPGSSNGPLALAAAACLSISMAPYLASLLWPTFTLRDTSRDLATLLQGQPFIASHEAEGLFVDNRLRYESHYRLFQRNDPPPVVVSFELPGRKIRFRVENYRLLKTYPLYVSPRYNEGPARVTVYGLATKQPESDVYLNLEAVDG